MGLSATDGHAPLHGGRQRPADLDPPYGPDQGPAVLLRGRVLTPSSPRARSLEGIDVTSFPLGHPWRLGSRARVIHGFAEDCLVQSGNRRLVPVCLYSHADWVVVVVAASALFRLLIYSTTESSPSRTMNLEALIVKHRQLNVFLVWQDIRWVCCNRAAGCAVFMLQPPMTASSCDLAVQHSHAGGHPSVCVAVFLHGQ